MKYFLNDTWCNDSTVTSLPVGATSLSDTEWDNRQNTPYVKTEEDLQRETNATNQAYLASTDWYITRFLETGVVIPTDVTTAREAARAAIV